MVSAGAGAWRGRRSPSTGTTAERLLGEGRRFGELKELNVGRAQPDGSVVERDSVLRAGWAIEVPRTGVSS